MDNIIIHILSVNEIEKNSERLIQYVSSERKNKALSYKLENDKYLSLGAAYFLKKYVGDDLYFNEYNKPYSKNKFFNISHSFNFVAFIECDKECGIDIERIREEKEELFNYAFDYKIKDSTDFYFRWTLKEALAKASGLGLSVENIKDIPSNEGIAYYKNSNYYLKSFSYLDYYIGLAIKDINEFSGTILLESIDL